jgi:AcrR family transcriptional regulator
MSKYDDVVVTSQMGRPREFNADVALDKAMLTFWQLGYEGAGITELTRAMGISRKSLYLAFGNKEQLFRSALQRYSDGPGGYLADAVRAPGARDVAEQFLRGAVEATTRAECPPGCLGVQGALAAGDTGQVARDILAEWRGRGQQQLCDRFQRAIDDGDLPAGTDPDLIARYVMTVANGIAVQAAGGATREQLRLVADAALLHWPPALLR